MKAKENTCKKAFRKSFEDCEQTIPYVVNKIICLPLKIDFICAVEDLYSGTLLTNVCDPSNVIDSKFGPEYVELRKFQEKFTAPIGDVSLNYTSQVGRSINGITEKINAKVDENLFYLESFVNLVCAFLVFVYCQVFYGNFNVVDNQQTLT